MLIVEKHYLEKHSEYMRRLWKYNKPSPFVDASFSENFYGLKRRRRPYIETDRASAAVAGLPGGQALRKQDIWRSLLLLVRKRNLLHHPIEQIL